MRGRHRIVAARVEGMAAADAPGGQPAAFHRTEPGDGFHRVFRAGRDETAARTQQRADEALVYPQDSNEYLADHVRMITVLGCRCPQGRL